MTHLTRRQLLRAGAAATLMTSMQRYAFAQPVETAALYDAAKREGAVNYYTSLVPSVTNRVVSLFQKTYPGIEVKTLRLATGQMARRYASEAQGGNVVADVIQLADPFLMADAETKGWITSMENLPDYAAFPVDCKTRFNALVGIFPHTIVCNTSVVSKSDYPMDWRKMLDPRWKGQIILADPRANIEITSWFYTMFDTYGADYLRQLRAQQPRWVESVVPGIQMLIAGEGALVAPALRQSAAGFAAQGAPVIDFIPDLDDGYECFAAISAKAPHPNAARLLANLLLTRAGQEAITRDFGISPLANIPGSLTRVKDFKHSHYKETLEKKQEMMALLGLA